MCSSCSVAVRDKHPCICPSWLVKSVQWSTCYSHWLLYEPRAVLTCRVCFVLPALLLSAWDFKGDCRRRRHRRTLTLVREALTQGLLVSLVLSCFVLPCFVLSCPVLQCHRQSWPCPARCLVWNDKATAIRPVWTSEAVSRDKWNKLTGCRLLKTKGGYRQWRLAWVHKTDETATDDFWLQCHLGGHSLVSIKLMRLQQTISDSKAISVDIQLCA